MRKIFAEYLKGKIAESPGIYRVVLGDISVGLFLRDGESDELFHDVINIGILEQSMISFAAGLSRAGITPVVHSISPFIIERAYEQLKLDFCYNQNKSLIVSANGPYDYRKLGPTHHCAADIPLINLLQKFYWAVPGRDEDVVPALEWALSMPGPAYVRLTAVKSSVSLIAGTIHRAQAVGRGVSNQSRRLVIAVGEALAEITSHDTDDAHLGSDLLYIWRPDQLPSNNLFEYDEVELWEPYSESVLTPRVLPQLKSGASFRCFLYPKTIEEGVFERPEYSAALQLVM